MAPRINVKDNLLAQAIKTFTTVTHYPEQGLKGTWRNAELRCIAFLGIAAAHQELNNPPQLIAESLIAAIQADPSTAELWLGIRIVTPIVRQNPPLQNKPVPTPPFPPFYWGLPNMIVIQRTFSQM